MNPKKPNSRKSKSAGISLEPDLIKRAKDFAEKNGFGSLSNLVRFLLTQELIRTDGETSYKLEEIKTGKDQTAAKGQAERGAGAKNLLPSESSVTLRSTATKTNIRRAG